MAGNPELPEAYLARHGAVDPVVSGRVRAIYSAFVERQARPAADAGALPYERLGEYRLLEVLDEGGMGTVFLAEQETLQRKVALKLIRRDLLASRTAVERFRREALAIARLRHRHIVQVIAAGEERGERYLVMEYARGESMARRLNDTLGRAEGPPGAAWLAECVEWCRQIADALACAHAAGVIHRDVKPSNIQIAPDGLALLLDFGVALADDATAGELTTTFAGSTQYAAPEQLAGAPVSERSDIYGLGVTLYQCVTGRVPFAGGSLEQMISRVAREDPVEPRRLNPHVGRDLEIVLLRALHKDPERRPDAIVLRDELGRVGRGEPIVSRTPSRRERSVKWVRAHPMTAGTIVLLIASLLAFAAWRAAAERRNREDARVLVCLADEMVDDYWTRREQARGMESELRILVNARIERYLEPREEIQLEQLERAAARLRRERDGLFHRVLDELKRAERIDPAVAGVRRVRARLYLEKVREAQVREDFDEAAFFRALARRADPDADVAPDREALFPLPVRTREPGAHVWIFRLGECDSLAETGERRSVPMPYGVETSVPAPGTFCLRIVESTLQLRPGDLIDRLAGEPLRGAVFVLDNEGEMRRGDRIEAVAGEPVRSLYEIERMPRAPPRPITISRAGALFELLAPLPAAVGDARALAGGGRVTARVVRDGNVREQELTAGVGARLTAIPLATSPGCYLGRTPLEAPLVPSGRYLLLFRRAGCLETRMAIGTGEFQGEEGFPAWLPLRDRVPPGFVAVSPDFDARPFLMMEREVTVAEYKQFLDAIDNPDTRVPGVSGEPGKPYWHKTDDGYSWPKRWTGRFPVVGVSWIDAKAYAAWRTERARHAGRSWKFRLPTFREWVRAAYGHGRYVFGNRFQPKWAKTCFAQREARLEAVMRYPIDESIHGVFDSAGSAREWVRDWYDEGRGLRRLCGGSWAQADPQSFPVYAPAGAEPDSSGGETGLRLVVEID